MTDCPQDCSACPIWPKSLFRDFSPALIDWLAARKTANVYAKKAVLFGQGETVTGIFCHAQGLCRVIQKDAHGNTRFARLVLPGDTSGHRSLFIETDYKGSADIISTQAAACFIPKQDILYLLANNASFAKNLVTKIANELERSEQKHISIKEKSARERLADLLHELCEQYSDRIGEHAYLLKSEISKRDIASVLSVANETVIRLMSDMKTEGLIRYEGKRIVVTDSVALARSE